MENFGEMNRASKSYSSKNRDAAINLFGKDCNTLRTFHESEERDKVLKNKFRLGEHSCSHYPEVPVPKSRDCLERVSKNEPYSVNKSHESLKNVSTIEPLADDVNVCANQLFTAPNTGTNISTEVRSDQKPIGQKTNFAQNCSRAVEIVDNKGPNHSSCKYLEKQDLLVKNMEEEYDKTCMYSKIEQPTLVCVTSEGEHCQTANSSLQTDQSNIETGNPSLHTGYSSLLTSNSSSKTANSSLQIGSNWALSGPCKHSLLSNKKPSSDDGLSCRICHSVTDLETLVSPCLCTGSMKYVHESCLLNWLKSSVKTKCELCLHEVPVKKLVKPLREVRL